jgi:BirA family biotin operon repressor/biotin-[acetyl-CoA-carboxylase] ligase
MHDINLNRLRQASFIKDVEWHETIASTNDRGVTLAGDETIATPRLIIAGQQTAGRGRGLNRWWSSAGALTFSLVFDPNCDLVARGSPALEVDRWPRVALTAGVALCDVLMEIIPQIPCRLKWPNDVLLGEKKLSGILVDVPPAASAGTRRLVLGMGINVNNSLATAPADIQLAGVALCDVAGASFDATQLLVAWLNRFADRLHALSVRDPALSSRWQSLCALKGTTVELMSGNRRVLGLCRGIDVDGALIVDTASGTERLYAGVLVRAGDPPNS